MVSRALVNFKKTGRNNLTPAKIRSRITLLKEIWIQCTNGHVTMLQASSKEEQSVMDYFKNQEFEKHEELYQSTLNYIAEALEEMEPPGSLQLLDVSTHRHCINTNSFSLSHLPPIKIPPFSGKTEDWESFRDRFVSLIIKNQDLTKFARMHFLASNLTGRALESIKYISITVDTFDIAWQALVSRYDNKRRLIDVHVTALHNLPTVARESAVDLIDLRDKANHAISSLRKLHRLAEILNDILVYSVAHKLDYATRKAWKLKNSNNAMIATFEDLDRFTARARVLEELTPQNKSTRAQRSASATSATASPLSCSLCKEAHFLNQCPQFKKKSPSQRLEVVQQFKRCVNCLSDKHALPACPSKYSCRTCQQKHYSMLHTDSASASNAVICSHNLPVSSETKDNVNVSTLHFASKVSACPRVLLATARVNIGSSSDCTCNVRALLDQGSEIMFISENLRQLLQLRRIKLLISISAIGGVNAGTCKYAAQIQISPVNQSQPVLASILNSLTRYSPSSVLSNFNWSHLADLNLADPCPRNSDPIDIIIGADLYSELILDGVGKESMVSQSRKTRFCDGLSRALRQFHLPCASTLLFNTAPALSRSIKNSESSGNLKKFLLKQS